MTERGCCHGSSWAPWVLPLLLACVVVASGHARAAQPPGSAAEHEVQAAFLYQFGRYVEWPAEQEQAGGTFVICLFGTDPFAGSLDEIVKGKSITGLPLAIKRVNSTSELRECQVLFVSRSEDDRLPAILKALAGQVILTVGEGAQFTRRGGMMAFTSEERRVRFVVNLAAAEAAGVKLSAQLLRIAARVEQR